MAIPMPKLIDGFRFGLRIDGVVHGVARCGEIEKHQERHGNWKLRPVTIEAAVKAGTAGLAALLGSGRPRVELDEYDRDGSVLRTLDLGRCRVRRYRCAAHDAMSSDLVFESVVVHPGQLRVRNRANPNFVEPHPVAEVEHG